VAAMLLLLLLVVVLLLFLGNLLGIEGKRGAGSKPAATDAAA